MLREENITLKTRLNELTEANVRLQESHLVLQGKCDTLLEDLSIKEARWSEKEDMLHAEVCSYLECTVAVTVEVDVFESIINFFVY